MRHVPDDGPAEKETARANDNDLWSVHVSILLRQNVMFRHAQPGPPDR
jgi:hypothetical protein